MSKCLHIEDDVIAPSLYDDKQGPSFLMEVQASKPPRHGIQANARQEEPCPAHASPDVGLF